LTLLVEQQEGHPACKKYGEWSWALVSPDGVAPSWMVSVSASVNLPLHHKVQKFSSGTGSFGWSWKNGHKMVVVVLFLYNYTNLIDGEYLTTTQTASESCCTNSPDGENPFILS